MHFSFVSSLVGLTFDTTDNALTIHRCGTATGYVLCIICMYAAMQKNINPIAVLNAWLWEVPVDGVQSTKSAEDCLMIAPMVQTFYR